MNDPIDLLGTGWALPVDRDTQGRVALASGPERVRQALQMLLGTEPGERIMRPDYGCALRALAFEPATAATAHLARFRIDEAIRRWEPRVELIDVRVEPEFDTQGRPTGLLRGDVIYRIKATNSLDRLGFVLPTA